MPLRKSNTETSRPTCPADARRALSRYFKRNGYVRHQNPERLAREGYMGYKKGDEVRLTADDERELQRIQELLIQAGFRPGRPFVKGHQYRLPIYGREAVRRFLQLVQSGGKAEPVGPAKGSPPIRSARTRKSPPAGAVTEQDR